MYPRRDITRWPLVAVAVASSSLAVTTTSAQDDSAVAWSGDYRIRYEVLDPQFRVDYPKRDEALVSRGRLRIDARLGNAEITGELMDSRAALNDAESPIFTSTVNTAELVQAHMSWDLASRSPDRDHGISFGVMTKDLGSRRLIARNRFRNTVNTFAGVDWHWSNEGGPRINAFYLSPLRRLPEDPEALLDNRHEVDDIVRDTLLAGVHVRWPAFRDTGWGELLAVRSSGPETRAPSDAWSALTTLGLRFVREPVSGRWDIDIESAIQRGRSSADDSADILDHSAYFTHVSAGYTFPGPARFRLAAQYDRASGDKDPLDDQSERFDTLYGSRRFDYGPTGINGPFLRSNLDALGLRATFQPSPSVAVLVAYQRFELASATDAWLMAGLRDPSGAAGKTVGRQIESAVSWTLIPDRLTLEAGVANLRYGGFALKAPNATGNRDSAYAYSHLLVTFGGSRQRR